MSDKDKDRDLEKRVIAFGGRVGKPKPGHYFARVNCDNCPTKNFEVEIPKGTRITDWPAECPNCGCYPFGYRPTSPALRGQVYELPYNYADQIARETQRAQAELAKKMLAEQNKKDAQSKTDDFLRSLIDKKDPTET